VALGLGRGLLVGGAATPPEAEPRGGPAVADRRGFLVANAAHLLANAALFAVWLLVPYYLIDRRGLPAAWGGILFAMAPLAQACATPLGGRLIDRGLARPLAPVGLVVEAAGLWLTGGLDAGASRAWIAVALGLAGFGSGLFIVANMHEVMGALPAARQGVAGSVVALMRTAGIVVGSNVTTAVYAGRLGTHAARGPAAAAAAFGDAFGVAALVAALGAVLSLVPPRRRDGSPSGRRPAG